MRNAERLRFTSFHSQGRFFNAKCRVQNAEWASLHFISFTWFYLSLIDFVVWMRYDAKGNNFRQDFTRSKRVRKFFALLSRSPKYKV